ncbi:tRNA (N6-threonylcarbamoyladenosine(37)-N6)-methyltransferase TrmO [Sedimentisphaera salicampi]|uniref:tRNA (N6-threonylcarbamoyladenosine(37)-N6)-methyltransferase TrmO n=1 Tax=Sedimentisphaera salicampi TaxID=1941349 RepID=UPI000B9B336F|nr:tRNA (N6-threonylcarbamoyladenosine(37)-N6)-methyltransferase TrmO [Sedimentisphaera salicampi]OXU16187.1 S-adenosyl-L-methionine-binding protein [Sedimentisphaera salicampi]
MEEIRYRPIGRIHTEFKDGTGVPRQAAGASELAGRIEIFDEYLPGLEDLEGFSHIVVVFHLHRVSQPSLNAHPPWDGRRHGVFATRSPYRPNPIGVSVVRLISVESGNLNIAGIDMADASPLLDIKPYVPELNPQGDIRLGWLEGKVNGMNKSKSGDR